MILTIISTEGAKDELKQAKDVPALKVVSENLMHSNLSIADGVYGILSGNDVRGQIALLGKNIGNGHTVSNDQLATLLEQLLALLKHLN